jgi:hypothetical protein
MVWLVHGVGNLPSAAVVYHAQAYIQPRMSMYLCTVDLAIFWKPGRRRV